MRIYTPAGDLAFKTFTFSDGQPHFKLETYEREFSEVNIEAAIRSPHDLFTVLLAASVLRSNGYSSINLDIRYLLGARMDRAISWAEPFTLSVVAGLINGCGFSKVRVLDAHSEVATRLIRHSENILPLKAVEQVFSAIGPVYPVSPDKGARERTATLMQSNPHSGKWMVKGGKQRDVSTGALTHFTVDDYPVHERPWNALIIDDICDGGGTFTGLAKKLREVGAEKVNLFVTHGIFSKGLPLEGIDKIYTTDSYFALGGSNGCWADLATDRLVVIPISMEKL